MLQSSCSGFAPENTEAYKNTMKISSIKELTSLPLSYRTASIIFLFFLIILQHLAPTGVLALSNETDHAALLAIKSQLDDHPFSSWNNSAHHCNWDGVFCGRKHNRVIALELYSRGLVGTISPFIGNLSFLEFISIYNNSLYGQIPPELGRLFRLRSLKLFNNTLTGGIPANLSACINLQRLYIYGNKLEGKVPLELKALSNLKNISLHFNNLSGPIFEVLTNLTSLEIISLAWNAFTGTIPPSIGKMRNLKVLAVEENDLSGTISTSIFNCSALEMLDIGFNKLKGELPPDIDLRLPHLVKMNLAYNQFSGAFPNSVSNLTNLEFLGLEQNNFAGRVSHKIGHLQNLWYLNLGENNLEGDINFVDSLVNCTQLQVLDLGDNDFTGMMPKSIANLSSSLRALDMSANEIRGEFPVGITNLVNLENIGLQNNELTGSIPRDLGKLQRLEILLVSSNKLTGIIPDSIRNLSRLSKFYLNDNQLDGGIPASLGSCQSLINLNLSNNHLSGTLVDEHLKGPAMFVTLDLSDNLLEGSIPLEISKQINLLEFHLSRNKLSGIIPIGLADCSALQILDVQGNSFHGHIPPSFSSLGSLQVVDLSQNDISGEIPSYFSKFPLILLNLSYNNFEGRVPVSGVFSNISAIALTGNKKLCGGIPELHLPRCIQPKVTRKMSHALKLTISMICALTGVLLIAVLLYLTCSKKKQKSASTGSVREGFIKVSYNKLLKATNGFSSENLLGSGSFGSVFRGSLDGKTVAVKILDLQRRGAAKSFMAECMALRNVRHRNLVPVVTACSSTDFQRNDFRALVYEFMPNGSLDGWLHGAQNLTLVQRVDIAIDVAHALNYLHNDCEIPVIHYDLKPSNILLDNDMVAHVGDFGLAKFLAQPPHLNHSSTTGIPGTVGYAAPEYGLGGEASLDGDLYSYGILLLELMTGIRPTDNMFEEGINIHIYAERALPDQVVEIADETLNNNEIDADVDETREIEATVQRRVECISTVVQVGVVCSNHLPQDRMRITEAISKLQAARNMLINAPHRRNIRRGG